MLRLVQSNTMKCFSSTMRMQRFVGVQRRLCNYAEYELKGAKLLQVVSDNNLEEAKKLLKTEGAPVNYQDHLMYAPIMRAVMNNNEEMVKVLLEEGANPVMEGLYGNNSLDLAKEDKNINILKILEEVTFERSLELVKAAQENDLQGVENMVSGGQCDINYQDKLGNTAIKCAAENNNDAMVKLLLKYGANPLPKDSTGRSAIYWAERHENHVVVTWFNDCTSRIEKEELCRELMLATLDNNMTTLQRLLRGGKVDVNYRDGVGNTAILRAVSSNNKDMVKVLLEAGANPVNENILGCSALNWAKDKCDKEMVALVESYFSKR